MSAPLFASRRPWLLACAAGGLALAAARTSGAVDAFEWRPWSPDVRGRQPPAIDLPLLDGGRWRLADQQGRAVLANFWATWCVPCRDEMPSLVQLARRRAADLVVVGVNYKESPAAIRRFLDGLGLGLSLPVLLDSDGQAAASWTPRIFPSTVLFDRRGRPLGTVVGEIDWSGPAATRILSPLLGTG